MMKARPKQPLQNGLKNSQAKGKIYVPITPNDPLSSSQIHSNSLAQSHPQLISNSPSLVQRHPAQVERQHPSLAQRQQSIRNENQISELKQQNIELREKEQIYIQKLIKLEEGLERQHKQFMQLQDLYDELYRSYKQKQQQVSQCTKLQMKFRESNRKKEASSLQKVYESQELNYRRIIQQKQYQINELESHVEESEKKCLQYEKTIQKLSAEISYQKNKQKINDSRATLNMKVFEELEEYQRQADHEKELKIKLEYENKFLRNRHQDLECRVAQLEEIIKNKQSQVLKLRQNSIMLSRSNSENKILRSASKSPRKLADKQNSMVKPKQNFLINNLQNENSSLKKQLQSLKLSLSCSQLRPQNFIKHQEFFSFSREDFSNHSSNQDTQKNQITKMSPSYLTNSYPENMSEGESKEKQRKQQEEKGTKLYFGTNQRSCQLQELPKQLEIESLINSTKMSQRDRGEF